MECFHCPKNLLWSAYLSLHTSPQNPSPTPATTDLFIISKALPFQKCHIVGITQPSHSSWLFCFFAVVFWFFPCFFFCLFVCFSPSLCSCFSVFEDSIDVSSNSEIVSSTMPSLIIRSSKAFFSSVTLFVCWFVWSLAFLFGPFLRLPSLCLLWPSVLTCYLFYLLEHLAY